MTDPYNQPPSVETIEQKKARLRKEIASKRVQSGIYALRMRAFNNMVDNCVKLSGDTGGLRAFADSIIKELDLIIDNIHQIDLAQAVKDEIVQRVSACRATLVRWGYCLGSEELEENPDMNLKHYSTEFMKIFELYMKHQGHYIFRGSTHSRRDETPVSVILRQIEEEILDLEAELRSLEKST